jgi:hypothetical protein
MFRPVSACALGVTLFASSASFAQTTGGDSIVLKNGGLYRGTVIDVVPGDHARIRLDTGEVTEVPWIDIDHVDETPTAPPPPPLSPPPPPAEKWAKSRVFVHMSASSDVALERGGSDGWAPVCLAPCDDWLPTDAGYRIGGSGIRESRVFALSDTHGDHVGLDVDAASNAAFVGGIVAGTVGYVMASVGTALLLIGTSTNADCSGDPTPSATCTSSGSGDGTVIAGAIVLGIGVVVGTVGTIVFASNIRSTARRSRGSTEGAPPSPTALRVPTWREAPSRTVTPATPNVLPLYTLTF